VGKIQSSIQRAIEKARLSEPGDSGTRRERGASDKPKNKLIVSSNDKHSEEAGSGSFQVTQKAYPDKDIMEENRFVSAVDDRAAIAAYKIFRTRVLQRMRSNNWHTLLVTSTGAGEGKTLTASNLALSIARDVNQSVLLVDLDLQRSKVAKCFGIETDIEKGIGDYLMGDAEISDIVYDPSGLQRISIIPNRGEVANSSDLLSSPRMKELLAWVRQQSDRTIVIFDMPPVLVDDDVLAFCPEIDAVLLVVAEGKTDRLALEKAESLLAETNMLGVIINRCNEKIGDGGYAYY
jgi:capsular exopolysaccharide synthesis family protein